MNKENNNISENLNFILFVNESLCKFFFYIKVKNLNFLNKKEISLIKCIDENKNDYLLDLY